MWARVGGRDALAALTGISPTQLSGYNSGKARLGRGNAMRIVAVIPGATLDELGIPPAKSEVSLQAISESIDALLRIASINTQRRTEWRGEIEGQLAEQTGLLATLSKLAADLTEAVTLLSGVAERLDSATKAPPRQQQPRRSA